MYLNRKVLFVCLLTLLMSGCKSEISSDPDDYVGEYLLTPSSVAPGEFASFVILRHDHTALEIRFLKATGQVLTNE
jgi:hypothetical protein